LALTVLLCAGSLVVTAQQRTPPAGAAVPAMLTVDGIMRGPKLVGASPTAVRWSKDSSKIYFTWQKAGDDRTSTYVVSPHGSGLRELSAEDARSLEPPPAGRPDRSHKRLLATEGGDIVIIDVATGARHMLMRTSALESNPRWARNDTAVTFMRDGNLYLMSIDG